MKCEQVQEYLTGYLLGDLDEATRSAVEAHLVECEGCRAQRRELELTLDLVRDALSAPSSVAIPQRLTPDRRARITSTPPARQPIRVLGWFSVAHPKFALAAAACVVLAFVIAGMMLPASMSPREKARYRVPKGSGNADTYTYEALGDASRSQTVSPQVKKEPGETVFAISASPAASAPVPKPLVDTDDDGINDTDISTADDGGSGGGRMARAVGTRKPSKGLAENKPEGVARERTDIAYKYDSDLTKARAGKMGVGGASGSVRLTGISGVETPAVPLAPAVVPPGPGSDRSDGAPARMEKADRGQSQVTANQPVPGAAAKPSASIVPPQDPRPAPIIMSPELATEERSQASRGKMRKVEKIRDMDESRIVKEQSPDVKHGAETISAVNAVAVQKDRDDDGWVQLDEFIDARDKKAKNEKSITSSEAHRRLEAIGERVGGGEEERPVDPAVEKAKQEEVRRLRDIIKQDAAKADKEKTEPRGRRMYAEATSLPLAPEVQVESTEATAAIAADKAKQEEGKFLRGNITGQDNGKVNKELVVTDDNLRKWSTESRSKNGNGSKDSGVKLRESEVKAKAVDELSVRGHSSRGPAAADRGSRAADAEAATGWTSDTSLRRVTEESAKKGQPQAEFEVRSESRLAGAAEVKELQRKPTTDNREPGPYYGHYLNPVTLRRVTESGMPKSPDVSDKSYAKDGRDLEKELAQARNAPGMDSNRKFDDGKKEGGRGDDRKALAESPRKVETTSLFGPSLSVIPVSEPTQLPAKFKAFGVNQFIEAASQPFSTFSIDVDTASYTVSRNYMLRGQRPPAEAVRTEEFVNFFDYAYAAPTRETFRIYADVAPSRFGRGLQLLKIGVKGKRVGREEERRAVLTFLVDTSGSMDKPDRSGLIRKSLKMLLDKLSPQDQVAIVQFDSNVRLALDHTPAAEKEKIAGVLDGLQCSGSTHLEGGMTRAYEVAARSFNPKAENRVLILSDGVANLGTMAAEDILGKVEAYRKQGIYCSVFGFGIGTFDDTMLETLANKGNGMYAFIDSETEAKRVFVDDLAATLNTIASDVKIQVEFNPKRVAKYRQLGYENRQLKKEDFRNDAIDAGEVGSGQSVTALYEVEMKDGREVVATVRLRYRRTDNNRVEEVERAITAADLKQDFEKADARFRLAACAAEFSEQLRGSPHAAGSDFADVASVLRPVALELPLDRQVQELLRMVQSAGSLSLAAQ